MTAAAAVGPVHFHVFLGAHSLLIGLLPFYLPVWLWKQGLGVDGLALLIAASGFCFAGSLRLWRRIAAQARVSRLIGLSFALEAVFIMISLAASLVLQNTDAKLVISGLAVLVGVTAGLYNAFFWTTQRALFAASLGANDAGKRYGNFQIYVAILLKSGIVIGGLFLDRDALLGLLGLSILIGLSTSLWLASRLRATPLLAGAEPRSATPDSARSTWWVFVVDGVFLLLESHFWTLSLFLLFGEDFVRLGILVVLLGVAFTVLFWLSKNLIDRVAVRWVYVAAVGLYSLSWILRSSVESHSSAASLGAVLIVVTFTTTFFRLTFNKRFFDHSRECGVVDYLVWKSRLSQRAIGVVFLGVALSFSLGSGDVTRDLSVTYVLAAIAALVYLAYRAPSTVK